MTARKIRMLYLIAGIAIFASSYCLLTALMGKEGTLKYIEDQWVEIPWYFWLFPLGLTVKILHNLDRDFPTET